MKKRLSLLALMLPALALAQPIPLQKGFQTPPSAAKPRVWWHWMNGNITKEGIRKDLLWMHRSGIGGFQNFDAAFMTPNVVEKRLAYMTPEWKEAFQYTTKLADSLKLEMAIAGSPGWSESGGPWVTARDGMKKLVWREVRVKGSMPFRGTLPKPFTTTGAFQNLALQEGLSLSAKTAPPPTYYEDVALVAYRLPAADVSLMELNPKITSSGGQFTLALLTNGDLAETNLLPRDSVAGHAWIQFEFSRPQTFKAISLVGGSIRSPFGIEVPTENRSLEASEDGVHFSEVASIPAGGVAQQTIAFPATTARYFRVRFQNPSPPSGLAALMGGVPKAPAGTNIAEIVLHPTTRINHAEEKAGFAATYDIEKYPTPAANDAVAEGDLIDLTGKMAADGSLNWTPPAGEWKIVRFGYSLTGKQNHPASPEATGLEVDKMDARAVRDYFTTYLNQYREATGGLMGNRGLQYMITDSYESGQETWTPRMAEEFQKRRGYSLLPWMPVLTGQVVKSTEASEKFLWDWRKTIAELIAENHYDQLTDILKTYGMKRYTESHENGRIFVVDGMDVKRGAAVPMSAMWVPTTIPAGSTLTMAEADIRESASVAHIYGQNLVAAESFTALGMGGAAWSFHPGNLKPTADWELASGVNRFVIHTSVHQPVDDKLPGLTLGPVGQWFNRHDTWANQAKAWTNYLARSSYMLQQGRFVADIVYYYGEDNNITGLFGNKLPEIPNGYSYDFINPHALLKLLSVKEGRLVTPSGMSYRVLHLDPNASRMSLPVLRKIAQLVKAGAVISGAKPEMAASQNDSQQEFDRLVGEVWGSSRANVHTGKTVPQVLTALNIQPDFTYQSQEDANLLYVHRKTIESDIYWVSTRSNQAETVEASFRISGKQPQIWHPETGKTEPASYRIRDGRTTVTLNLTSNDAVFVVFGAPATKTMVTLPAKTEKEVLALEGAWNVTFQPDRGAPTSATFDKLMSFTESPDAGIKYFSGTATYTSTIDLPADAIRKGEQLWLDLGEVGNLAEVVVNGKSLGVVWKKPFRVNATTALKPGANKIEIKVTNLWVNRLIGDQQPRITTRFTQTSFPYFTAKSLLQPSGLLGPVRLVSVIQR
ncbi:glycosyl hydrolase [Telluribacter sp.]|jgi:hypothetical protein|uniref:glycosyl hydrolase n=1 Tax=Telluribacter sp. TaxID=1978767 RepID=UPI002E0FA90B|nr:glycosyl hydrolase [Telluribacter sp.]